MSHARQIIRSLVDARIFSSDYIDDPKINPPDANDRKRIKTKDTTTRYLYHGSKSPDLHRRGIETHPFAPEVGLNYSRSWFTSEPQEAASYGHVYRLDLHHPNMAKGHAFKYFPWNVRGSMLANKYIPPGDHLKKIDNIKQEVEDHRNREKISYE